MRALTETLAQVEELTQVLNQEKEEVERDRNDLRQGIEEFKREFEEIQRENA